MKFIKILVITVFIYTICGISTLHASSINPAIQRLTLAQGQKKYSSVEFNNSENIDIEISVTPYAYNPKTDEISEDMSNIFLKADTDTFSVKANSSFTINYEIYPLSNLSEGSYFNILALTPLIADQDIKINTSIAQLVILDIVTADSEVKGITTTQYTTQIQVVKKGIPFITPLVLKYTIGNSSNYLLTPGGRIDVFNEKNSYKPIYIYINEEEDQIYPGESLEKVVEVKRWHFFDLFLKRIVMGEVYNGIDNNPKYVGTEINNFVVEIFVIFTALIIGILFFKSIKQDLKGKKNLKKKEKIKKKIYIEKGKKTLKKKKLKQT